MFEPLKWLISYSLWSNQERQKSKDGSSPCSFRLSSEGLPLLLPYISKQILYASFVDFQHLLQYRTIKFMDFVDTSFGEKASNSMSGCCVVVLNEGDCYMPHICSFLDKLGNIWVIALAHSSCGKDCALIAGNQSTDDIVADASTIAIVCWKGKTNVSALVSPLDAKELLERLAVRFGSERGTLLEENEETNSEIDTTKNSEDAESAEGFEMADQEGFWARGDLDYHDNPSYLYEDSACLTIFLIKSWSVMFLDKTLFLCWQWKAKCKRVVELFNLGLDYEDFSFKAHSFAGKRFR